MQLILIKDKLTETFALILSNRVLRLSLNRQSWNSSGNKISRKVLESG